MFYRQLKSELWKLFGKKRTYIGFGAFLISQNAMLLLFRFTKLPNCPDCNACELQGECYTRDTLANAASLYPVLLQSHVEQTGLAWVSSSS